MIEVDFSFEYGNERASNYFRMQKQTFSVNIMQGLQLVHFSVLPSDMYSTVISSNQISPSNRTIEIDANEINKENEMIDIDLTSDENDDANDNNSNNDRIFREIISQGGNDICLLMFEILNTTSHMFWISYYVQQSNQDRVNHQREIPLAISTSSELISAPFESTIKKRKESIIAMGPRSCRRFVICFFFFLILLLLLLLLLLFLLFYNYFSFN